MNEHDTERMYALLEAHKFTQAPTPESADMIIINSCSVREKPVHKVMSEVGTYRDLKARKPNLKIGIAGCVGQQEGEKILQGNKLVDFVMGTGEIDNLPEIVRQVRDERKRVTATAMHHRDDYKIETLVRNPKVSSFVTITKGCDNFCSFCVVPFTRGREKSRVLSDIVRDVHELVDRQVKEITLLGQNVNSYKSPDGNGGFNDLLRAICTETKLERLRYTTSHPKDFNDELINLHVKHQDKLGLFLHLPVQSGSSEVLERMNRGYTREEYLEKVMKLKKALPEVALSTDVIVGFPGETEEQFEETLSLLSEVRYENVYAFKYSARPFTKALKFKDHLTEEQKDARLQRLMDLQDTFGDAIVAKYDQKTYDVLVEGPSRTNKEVLTGRTTHWKVVNFVGPQDLIGKTVPVKVIKAQPFSLRGELI
jgi:tRNA-2-methylthio-N6-dimethylallyladenosine synthase